jgi:hypothetical protein
MQIDILDDFSKRGYIGFRPSFSAPIVWATKAAIRDSEGFPAEREISRVLQSGTRRSHATFVVPACFAGPWIFGVLIVALEHRLTRKERLYGKDGCFLVGLR